MSRGLVLHISNKANRAARASLMSSIDTDDGNRRGLVKELQPHYLEIFILCSCGSDATANSPARLTLISFRGTPILQHRGGQVIRHHFHVANGLPSNSLPFLMHSSSHGPCTSFSTLASQAYTLRSSMVKARKFITGRRPGVPLCHRVDSLKTRSCEQEAR